MEPGASKPQQHSAKSNPSQSRSSMSVVASTNPKPYSKTQHPPKASGKSDKQLESSVERPHPRSGPDNKRPPTKSSGSKAHPSKSSENTALLSTSRKRSNMFSFREQSADPSSSPELPESPSSSEESSNEQQSEDEENQEMEIPQQALSDVLRCYICFETLVQPRTLPCQHNYCHACLAKYIRINYRHFLLFKRRKAVVCPVCKTPGAVPNPDRDPDGKDWAEQFKPGLAIQQLLDARVPVSQGRKDANRLTSIHESLRVQASLPLHRACQEGKLDLAKAIISEGKTDINSRDMTIGGQTPVMTAAWYGQNAVCAYLIKQGCDLSAVSETGTNLLHCACFGGDLNTVKTLTKKKIFHINIMDTFNQTPIMFAAAGGHVDVFTYLTNMGCDVTGVDVYSNNILHAACEGDNVEMVKHILSLNIVDKESRGQYGRTPLMYVAGYGHLELFNFLVSIGCNMRAIDEHGNNTLHCACIGGYVEMVKHILSLNVVDKESRGQYGRTPLMYVAGYGHLELFNFLVSIGCNMRALGENGNNILHVACIGGNVDMVKHVLSLNVVDKESRGQYGRTPLMPAAVFGHLELFNFLVSIGCNMRALDENGNNILHVACIGGNVEIVKHIQSLNVVDKESRGYMDKTPLLTAARYGHVELFKFLFAKGCNITTRAEMNCTVLHYACVVGAVDMVKHLLSIPAVRDMIHLETSDGDTAADMAQEVGHRDIVTLLNEH